MALFVRVGILALSLSLDPILACSKAQSCLCVNSVGL